ncbi:hypothetical protein VNO78_04831 [Psophocarpus tetragonolobus]|uniref:Uncharacterized protein n=1 Tax=Psophocarpus tetragonolobus TaxID=3891 RepID=A0AAN9T2V7_PSOTE
MMDGTCPGHSRIEGSTSINSSSSMVTEPVIVNDTPIMRNDDIELASVPIVFDEGFHFLEVFGVFLLYYCVYGQRGTSGNAAPELRLPFPHKCNIYNLEILLFEIIGRR